MYNWSPVPFDSLLHSFYSSGNITSVSRKLQTSPAIIPVNSFHVKGRHVMGRQLLASFLFDFSFCISTVLPLVIHRGVFPSRQALRCYTRFLYKLVKKFFSQNPWTPSGPGAFSFSYEICARASLFFLFISFLISFNQVASLLCSTSWPQIAVQNIFASCALGITIFCPSSLLSICL